MTPEFSRPERVDAIGTGPRPVAIAAEEGERAALAARFGLLSVDRLEAQLTIRREGASIVVEGEVTAAAVQPCSVTGDPVPATIAEPVALRFVEGEPGPAEEIELSADALDVIGYEGGAVDLGEAAAETMALALDPFPRSPRAAEALREAGVLAEEDTGAFAGLAGLKAKLEGR